MQVISFHESEEQEMARTKFAKPVCWSSRKIWPEILGLVILLILMNACGPGEKGEGGWLTFRYDRTHSGYSEETVPVPLTLVWSYQSPLSPQPAWPEPGEEMERMQMDNAFYSSAAYGLVFFGSSLDHKVRALDAATGQEKWHFFTEGPVRYAPTIADGRIYVGSDDGSVYCLNAKNGRLLWKYRAGPSPEKLLGNGSMISLWPIRTNVLVDDGIVYFGAGVFPYEGIYICALDALDGSIAWKNDTIGDQEHELAFGGISPQGYLVASEEVLYVPSSRAMPAAFDKKNGDFLYYLDPGGKIGGTWAVLDREHLIAGVDQSGTPAKRAYDQTTGERIEDMHVWFPGIDLVITPDTSYTLTKEGLYALNRFAYQNLQQNQIKDIRQKREDLRAQLSDISARLMEADSRKSKQLERQREDISRMIAELAEVENLLKPEMFRWEVPSTGLNTIILAGESIFAGGKDKVLGFDAQTGNKFWQTEIPGDVKGLSAAGGRLFVSTAKGGILCFGQGEGSNKQSAVASESDFYRARKNEEFVLSAAELIIERTGIDKGWALVLGCQSDQLAYELARMTDLKIIALTSNDKKKTAIRDSLSLGNLYGHRIVVANWDLETLPDYFANLIVCEDLITDGKTKSLPEEIFRVLKPYGGKTVFCLPSESPGQSSKTDPEEISAWFEPVISGGPVEKEAEGAWLSYTRGHLDGAGEWTEEYGNPGNTACSNDKLVRGPLGILWFGEPGSKKMMDRHAKSQSPLSMDGRLFIQGEEVVMAYDNYNGTLLWEREIPGAIRPRADIDGGNFSLTKDALYVGAYDLCLLLDPATGETLSEFELPDTADSGNYRWAHVSATENHLFGSRAAALPRPFLSLQEALVKDGRWVEEEEVPLEYLDQYRDLRNRYPEPADGLIEDFKRSGVLWELMAEFPDWENYNLTEGALTDRLMVSDVVFALDPDTGQLQWQHRGNRIAHITISKGQGHVFFAESAVTAAEKSRAIKETQKLADEGKYIENRDFPVRPEYRDFRTVFALDQEAGRVKWKKTIDFTGCGGDTLASAFQNGVLLFFSSMGSHDYWRHETGALRWKRMTALDAETGEVLWSHPNNYRTRPLVVGDRVFIEPRVCDLRTGDIITREHPISGQTVPWEYLRPGHTCAITSASASMLFYRSSVAAITDFEKDDGLTLFGGIRPGCWINMIPAGGVLLFPEASAGCTCSFPLRGSLVLKHKPGRWPKGKVIITHGPMTPVEHFAINLGASSDMKDGNGRVWFAYPNPDTNYTQNHYPNYGVKFNLNEKIIPGMGYFNKDYRNEVIPGTDRYWLYTSGALGVTGFEIPLIDEVWGEAPGSYTVRLGFKAPDEDKRGRRVFSINLQGKEELADFDIRAESGTKNGVVIKEFRNIQVSNFLSIGFAPLSKEAGFDTAPLVNFIELIREDEIEPSQSGAEADFLTAGQAESMLSDAQMASTQNRTDEALEKFHAVLERAQTAKHKRQALSGLAEIASPLSLPKIAPYCKNIDPVIRGYKNPDPVLKKSAVKVFIAIGDRLSQKDKDLAMRMMNRALRFTDPEDLENLDLIMARLRVLREESVSRR
jgi:outer membrane protein assembly factor BamB